MCIYKVVHKIKRKLEGEPVSYTSPKWMWKLVHAQKRHESMKKKVGQAYNLLELWMHSPVQTQIHWWRVESLLTRMRLYLSRNSVQLMANHEVMLTLDAFFLIWAEVSAAIYSHTPWRVGPQISWKSPNKQTIKTTMGGFWYRIAIIYYVKCLAFIKKL